MQKETIYRIFSNIPPLTTERLKMHRISPSDCDDMFEFASRRDVTKYMTWEPHETRSFTKEYLKYISSRYRVGDYYEWGIYRGGKFIGTCGFTRFDFNNDVGEIGYILNPEYGGQGYATEAARRVIEFGFDVLKLHRIEAEYIKGNIKSRSVMERVGMTFEGFKRDAKMIKGEYRTIGVCSILSTEYKEQKRQRQAEEAHDK